MSNCADTNSCHSDSELKDTAAESFIRDGLSKVMKITNICDSEHLSDCGLPDKRVSMNGSDVLNLSEIKTINEFNPHVIKDSISYIVRYEQLNTKASAFETANGESILVYYNPNCEPNLNIEQINEYTFSYHIQPKICANFVYDLNGKKGPNMAEKILVP